MPGPKATDETIAALRSALKLGPNDPDIEPGHEQDVDTEPFVHRLVPAQPPAAGEIEYEAPKSAGPELPPPFRKGGRYDELLQRLPIGESRALTIGERTAIKSAVRELRRRGSVKRFAIRKLSDTGIGIWRLPDAPKETP